MLLRPQQLQEQPAQPEPQEQQEPPDPEALLEAAAQRSDVSEGELLEQQSALEEEQQEDQAGEQQQEQQQQQQQQHGAEGLSGAAAEAVADAEAAAEEEAGEEAEEEGGPAKRQRNQRGGTKKRGRQQRQARRAAQAAAGAGAAGEGGATQGAVAQQPAADDSGPFGKLLKVGGRVARRCLRAAWGPGLRSLPARSLGAPACQQHARHAACWILRRVPAGSPWFPERSCGPTLLAPAHRPCPPPLPLQDEIRAWQRQQAKLRRLRQQQQPQQQQQQQGGPDQGQVVKFQIEQERPICRFWQLGRCNQGDACPYRHEGQPLTKSVPCKYFRVGKCSKGDACAYSHDLSAEACRNLLLAGARTRGSARVDAGALRRGPAPAARPLPRHDLAAGRCRALQGAAGRCCCCCCC